MSSLKHYKLDIDSVFPTSNITYNCDSVQQLVGPVTDHLLGQVRLKPKTLETIQQRRQGVMATLEVCQMSSSICLILLVKMNTSYLSGDIRGTNQS